MNESERLERFRESCAYQEYGNELAEQDEEISSRIASLLNHPQIDKYCMVDAYYYDFSVIPRGVQERLNLWRDVYLIYGITTEGEMITKWVDRWDLDSSDPIVDGKIIPQSHENKSIWTDINQFYNPQLLSTPTIKLI